MEQWRRIITINHKEAQQRTRIPSSKTVNYVGILKPKSENDYKKKQQQRTGGKELKKEIKKIKNTTTGNLVVTLAKHETDHKCLFFFTITLAAFNLKPVRTPPPWYGAHKLLLRKKIH